MASKRKCVQEVLLNVKTRKNSQDTKLKPDSVELDEIKEENGCTTQNVSLLNQKMVELTQSALTKILLVDALESIPVLKKKCALLGIKGNFNCPVEDDQAVRTKCHGEYEVEQILDHDTEKHLYFVKWRGYGTDYSTWEPIDHLVNVPHLTRNFRLMERSVSEDNQIAYKELVLLSCLLNELISSSNQDPFILLKLTGERAGMEFERETFFAKKNQFKVKSAFVQSIFIRGGTFQLNYCSILQRALKDLNITEAFGSVQNLSKIMIERNKFVKCLKTWETNINRLILEQEGSGSATIEIENNYDFDSPFEDFTYITKCIPGMDICVSEDPLLFCDCNDCVANSSTCCPKVNGSNLIYNERGVLVNMKQTTIFECNSKCGCPSTCPNRVIQNGRKFQLGIFKTADGRGWGVKALEKIPKGKFVVEYVGEIITEREAQNRTATGQNPFHKSYLFDMEYEVGTHCDYVLDGAKFGNLSRFINHSCTPNMEVYPFWTGNPDMKMPRISLFTKRIVAAGEELTFDYRMSAPVSQHRNKSDTSMVKVPCKCGSKKCRKFLY